MDLFYTDRNAMNNKGKGFLKGTRFNGPEGQFYDLARDLNEYDLLWHGLFLAGGGAPEPKPNEKMVTWLADKLKSGMAQ